MVRGVGDPHFAQLRGILGQWLGVGLYGSTVGSARLEGGWALGREWGCFTVGDRKGIRIEARGVTRPRSGRDQLLLEHVESQTWMDGLLDRLEEEVRLLVDEATALGSELAVRINRNVASGTLPPDHHSAGDPNQRDYCWGYGIVLYVYGQVTGISRPELTEQPEGGRQALRAGASTLVVASSTPVLASAASVIRHLAQDADLQDVGESVRQRRMSYQAAHEAWETALREMDMFLEAGRPLGHCHICFEPVREIREDDEGP